jgi:tetrapyrrole methylase family protein / MazG family protein
VLDALVTEARLRFGLDPAAGLQIIASERLIGTPLEPSRPVLVVPLAMLLAGGPVGGDAGVATGVTPLPGRHGPRGREPLDVLARAYPAEHPVGRFGTHPPTTIGELQADDLAAPFYLAPLEPEAAVAGPWAMPAISDRLRAPDGCPWDREQTHASLRNHLLEEAYEVYDALEGGASPELAGELGDLWLQIVLHAQLAAEEDIFDLTDVQAAIASKIVRRHPHVFGEAEARTASDVNRQWERIKATEREQANGTEGAPKGALDGIARSLPGLAASQEMQERAANIGYDWPSIDGVLDKVIEETEELREAAEDGAPAGAWAEELGDLLFVLVNVARKRGVDAEAAMRSANAKFKRRFGRVEAMVAERGVALRDLDFEALDELWDAAKAEERITT